MNFEIFWLLSKVILAIIVFSLFGAKLLFFFTNFAIKGKIMALNTNKNPKLYYSIKEVAKIVGVNESTLRYWETEFPSVRPKTVSATKVRQYTEKDIEEVKKIYNLIKVRGFKIAAARNYIRENKEGVDKSSDVIETLVSVREQLKDLKKHLDML